MHKNKMIMVTREYLLIFSLSFLAYIDKGIGAKYNYTHKIVDYEIVIFEMSVEVIMFYCRDEELRKLNKRYNDGKFECIVIYGRR